MTSEPYASLSIDCWEEPTGKSKSDRYETTEQVIKTLAAAIKSWHDIGELALITA